MLFKKKNKTDNAPAQEAPKTEETLKIPNAKFATRIAAVFNRMYGVILSVDLTNNAYQLESGEGSLLGTTFELRGGYDSLFESFSKIVDEDSQKKYNSIFQRNALAGRLSQASSVCEIICMCEKTEEKESYHQMQIRAERIPEFDSASPRTRCIIFVKEVESPVDLGVVTDIQSQYSDSEEWTTECVKQTFGGQESILGVYDVVTDSMMVQKRDGTEKVVEKYKQTLKSRADWTISHDDIVTVNAALEQAISGERAEQTIHYRQYGEKSGAFHIHRLVFAPAFEGSAVKKVYMALVDVDEQSRTVEARGKLGLALNKAFSAMYPYVREIDMEHDLIYPITEKDDGFARGVSPEKFSTYIASCINNKIIQPESADVFKDIVRSGYLRKMTHNQVYEVEVALQLPGQPVGRYSMMFFSMPAANHFIQVYRDISDVWDSREETVIKAEQAKMAEYNAHMLREMAGLVEFRNTESGAHIANVCNITRILLEDMRERSPQYGLTKSKIDTFVKAAMTHDIGKVTIPDAILNKPGKFSAAEYDKMKTHTTAGGDILRSLYMPGQEETMEACSQVARYHHERFDGSGYPEGLTGDAIPLAAQVVGLADSCDALISARCYKDAIPADEAFTDIFEGKCGAFNPRILESFSACREKIVASYERRK